jgi:hypothetical protein
VKYPTIPAISKRSAVETIHNAKELLPLLDPFIVEVVREKGDATRWLPPST